MRRLRAAERADYQVMLERTPGYADMLERDHEIEIELERMQDLEEAAYLRGCNDLGSGGRAVCDEGHYCERHYREAEADHAYLRGVPRSAVMGELSDEQVQDLRDAGRGHLVRV
jgi:hypothetical protein